MMTGVVDGSRPSLIIIFANLIRNENEVGSRLGDLTANDVNYEAVIHIVSFVGFIAVLSWLTLAGRLSFSYTQNYRKLVFSVMLYEKVWPVMSYQLVNLILGKTDVFGYNFLLSSVEVIPLQRILGTYCW